MGPGATVGSESLNGNPESLWHWFVLVSQCGEK